MRLNRWITLFVGILLLISLAACGAGRQPGPTAAADSKAAQERGPEPGRTDPSTDSASESNESEVIIEAENGTEESMRFFIGNTEVSVAWEKNASVGALMDLAKAEPIIIDMSMYGGFEQVGSLGAGLPSNDARITTQAGDIVLYAGNQIVVFYGSNAWAYTRLGRITDKNADEMAALLGSGNVTITITYGG